MFKQLLVIEYTVKFKKNLLNHLFDDKKYFCNFMKITK